MGGNVRISTDNMNTLRSVKRDTGGTIEFLVNKAVASQYTEKPKKESKKVSGFIVPELKEVTDYFIERSSTLAESSRFHNYYESNGWKVGKNKMKLWKSAASNWINKNSGGNHGQRKQSLTQRSGFAREELFAQIDAEEASSSVLGANDQSLRLQVDE